MHYADTLGAANIVRELRALAANDPIAWRISPVLEYCANTDTLLTQYRRNTDVKN